MSHRHIQFCTINKHKKPLGESNNRLSSRLVVRLYPHVRRGGTIESSETPAASLLSRFVSNIYIPTCVQEIMCHLSRKILHGSQRQELIEVNGNPLLQYGRASGGSIQKRAEVNDKEELLCDQYGYIVTFRYFSWIKNSGLLESFHKSMCRVKISSHFMFRYSQSLGLHKGLYFSNSCSKGRVLV